MKRPDAPELPGGAPSKKYDSDDFLSMLRVFYDRVFPFDDMVKWEHAVLDRVFPFDDMVKWLSYGGGKPEYFHNREFSMTFPGDIYARYQCYRNADEFAAAIRKSAPIKIDIGAVFNARPSEHKSLPAPIVPEERELVFDIDLTDYDDVRKCCSKTAVCAKCFSFMTVAVKVLDDMLRGDFGFKHMLWVFSGRRGIHCWVCDTAARQMSNMQRSAVADYMAIAMGKNEEVGLDTRVSQSNGGARGYKRDVSSIWSSIHPSLDRVYNKHLLECFERLIVEDHLRFDDATVQQSLLKDVPPDVCAALRAEWAKPDITSSYKWKQFKATMITCFKAGTITHTNPILDVVFRYCYPRLDINVSKGLNHLLKSPFVVHPSTGNVCVPINPATIEQFDLARVPKLATIMAQLDAGTATDMDAAVQDFRRLFLQPLDAAIRAERIALKQQEQWKAEPMEF